MKDEKFDELFDEAFERVVSSASPVDATSRQASWQRVQQHRLQQTRRVRRKRTIRLTGAAAGLILLGSVIFSEPVRTGALSPIYQKLYTWSTGEAVLFTGKEKPLETEGALTPPPPEGIQKPEWSSSEFEASVISFTDTTMSMEEARQALGYPMPEFPRVPEDLKLQKVSVMVPDDDTPPVTFTLTYKGENEREVMINVDLIPEDENRVYSFGSNDFEEVMLDNNLPAKYVHREYSDLIYTIRGKLGIMVSGTVTREELLDIAGHVIDG
ncbi:DUF4367 domain-containing protein [Saccharibacillus sp. JS10]|uniref:DUF4367 domain-containing protein n=1 Tax=Saccharibacillus sp. JS10 TaxID=2950552 RepID=UPI00210EBFF8|nr:DUF4367 domain-containing protein [Saccharibacillus sp. JS10]MCQ4085498.1 DUF4367 domain-containing protein [Saccharibacillus sp. JS10]